jgi:hypothetical protein
VLGQQDGVAQHDVELPGQSLVVDRQRVAVVRHADDVDEPVDPAQRRRRVRHEPLHVVATGQVAHPRHAPDLFGHLACELVAHIATHDPGSALGQGGRRLTPDALARTRDQQAAAIEAGHRPIVRKRRAVDCGHDKTVITTWTSGRTTRHLLP